VAGAHATVVGVDGGPGAATVVEGASDVGGVGGVGGVGVVEVVDVEVVAGAGDDPGVESTGVVGGVVAAGAGGVGVGAAGVLGVVQSSSAALAVAGTDDATAPFDRVDVLGVLAATVLELVWPSMRCRMVRVDDSCTVPSTLSVVVRSPSFTVAVLKIEGAALDAFLLGLRFANAAAAAPASATQMIVAITTRRLR
jgi:hypothetical protein